MAELEAQKPAPLLPLYKGPSNRMAEGEEKTTTPRVTFLDQFRKIPSSILDDRDPLYPHKPAKCRTFCLMCCAWTFLAACTLALTILVLAFSFYALIQSELPVVHVQKIYFPKLSFNDSSTGKKLFKSAVDIDLQIFNKNEVTDMEFSPLKVNVFDQDIVFGYADVPEFLVGPRNMTMLQIHTSFKNSTSVQADLGDIVKNKGLVLDVFVHGHIGFTVGGLNIQSMPVDIFCQDLKESDFSLGNVPKCSVKTFAFGAFSD